MSQQHPRILVSATFVDGRDTKSLNAIMASLRATGADPVLVANHQELISKHGSIAQAVSEKVKGADGIVIMGNNDDIDPAKYGETPHPKTKIETNDFRAEFENTLILKAMKQQVPLLGICGGMQRINVVLGGKLKQHVDEHHQGDVPGFQGTQKILFAQGTRLNEIAGNGAMENSFHHQVVSKLGQGLRVNAKAEDGHIEGFETDPSGVLQGHYIMGVQWHPEFGASQASTTIIGDVVGQAKVHAEMHAMPLPTLQQAYSVIHSGGINAITAI